MPKNSTENKPQHKDEDLIPLSEAELLFGWSRDWWAKKIKAGTINSVLDETKGKPRHMLKYIDAKNLSETYSFEAREDGRGRPRKFLRTNLRKRDAREASREKAIEEGGMLVQVMLSPSAGKRFEEIRAQLSSSSRKVSKKYAMEQLILNYPLSK